jgi:hypothetical protein
MVGRSGLDASVLGWGPVIGDGSLWTFSFHERRVISWLTERLLNSEEHWHRIKWSVLGRPTFNTQLPKRIWDSAGLRAGWSRVRIPAKAGNFSLHHRVQTGSGAHPASYPMGTRGSFPGGKAAGAWIWPLTSIWCRGQECVEMYLHCHNTP